MLFGLYKIDEMGDGKPPWEVDIPMGDGKWLGRPPLESQSPWQFLGSMNVLFQPNKSMPIPKKFTKEVISWEKAFAMGI